MRKIYGKLVRDSIPDIIREKGGIPDTRILSNDEYLVELKKKLREEIEEYFAAKTSGARLEEMADIFEVITALNRVESRSLESVMEAQKKKRIDRGGFERKIFLESVEEE